MSQFGAVPQVAPMSYGGFWIRFVALFIDGIVLSIANYALAPLFGTSAFQVSTGQSTTMIAMPSPALLTVSIGLPMIYTLLFWIFAGATPGKMALGLRIVDANTGQPISAGQAIGRYFGYFVSTLVFLLGFIWAGFDSRKQGWHDKLAGTVVVRRSRAATFPA